VWDEHVSSSFRRVRAMGVVMKRARKMVEGFSWFVEKLARCQRGF